MTQKNKCFWFYYRRGRSLSGISLVYSCILQMLIKGRVTREKANKVYSMLMNALEKNENPKQVLKNRHEVSLWQWVTTCAEVTRQIENKI